MGLTFYGFGDPALICCLASHNGHPTIEKVRWASRLVFLKTCSRVILRRPFSSLRSFSSSLVALQAHRSPQWSQFKYGSLMVQTSPFRVKMIRRTIDTKACLIPRPQISPTFLARFDFGNDSRFFDRIDDQAASAAPHALTPGASELRLQLFCLASGAPILLGVAFRSGNRAAKMVPAALD